MKNTVLFSLLAIVGTTHHVAAETSPKPNIIHILTDDLGWQDVAAYVRKVQGKEAVYETPNLDRMAEKGRVFMQAYSPCATCAPSRAAYMSGKFTPHTGVLHVTGGLPPRPMRVEQNYFDGHYPARLDLDTPTIARVLGDAGYLTGHIKKWHFGGRNDTWPDPLAYGFEFSWEASSKDYNDTDVWDKDRKNKADYWNGIWKPLDPRHTGFATADPKDPYRTDPNDDDRPLDGVSDLAVKWLDKAKNQGKPFFLNLCPSLVHGPISTRDKKRLRYYCQKMGVPFPQDSGKITEKTSGQVNPYYASMIDGLDWSIGKLLTFLETTDDPRNPGHKLIDNTFLIVSADNGGAEGNFGTRERVADNSPLRGGKSSIYEGGIRIPFLVMGPGVEPGSSSETPVNLIDLFPTFMAIAGADPRGDLDLDGCNILPVILGESNEAKFADGRVRDTLYFTLPTGGCSASTIRTGGWKLHVNHAPEDNGRPSMELFQLYHDDGSVADLGEQTNLIESEPAKRDELLADLKGWLEKFDAQLPYKNTHPLAPGKPLPGADKAPSVIAMSADGKNVSVFFETGPDKSCIVRADLIYTTNGSDLLREKASCEEWFRISAEVGDGVAKTVAPPGMTHGIFYLRDENGFCVSSKKVPHSHGKGGDMKWSITKDSSKCYAWSPGLQSMIATARSASANAEKKGLNTAELSKALESAEKTAARPAEEKPYATAMRNLRHAIRALDVPEAKLSLMNLYTTPKWTGGLGLDSAPMVPKKG